MQISLCLIAKNEEATIERCIESVKDVIHEIIVVDTGSQDKTIEIAKNIGAKTFNFKWISDFSAARNYAISKVTGDWIIFLDADEYIDRNQVYLLRKYILETEKKGFDTLLTGLINVNSTSGQFQSSTKTIRIFKNNGLIKYRGKIHETLYTSKGSLKYSDVSASISVFHTGYTPEVVKNKKKSERNVKILMQELDANPSNADLHFYIAESLMIDGQYNKAISHLEKAIKFNNGRIKGILHRCFSNMLTCMYEEKRDITQLYDVYKRAINLDANYPDFHFFLGLRELDLKHYSKSTEHFYKCLDKIERYDYDFESRTLTEVFNIYRTLINLNIANKNFNEVIRLAVNILKVEKYDYNTLYILCDILLKNEQVENVLDFIFKLFDKDLLKDKLYLIKVAESIKNESFYFKVFNLLNENERAEYVQNKGVNDLEGLGNNYHDSQYFINDDKIGIIKDQVLNFVSLKNYNEALELINQTLQDVKKDADLYSIKAVILMQTGNYESATEILNKGLALNPQHIDCLYNLAFVYKQNNQKKMAIELYLKVLNLTNEKVLLEEVEMTLRNLTCDNWVSIIIPAYNQKDFLKEAVESALAQDYPKLEVIVGDDNSTDGTKELMENYSGYPQLKYIKREENLGSGDNPKDLLYNHCTSKYVMFLDHDDYLIKKDYISQAVRLLETNPQLSLVWANCYIKNEELQSFSKTEYDLSKITNGLEYFINYEIGEYKHITGSLTTVFHREKAIKLGCFTENTKSKDLFLYLKLMLSGDIGFIKDRVSVYRVHRDSISYNMPIEYDYSTIDELEKLKEFALLEKGLSNHVLEKWLTLRLISYFRWRLDTLKKMGDHQSEVNLYNIVVNLYPKIKTYLNVLSH